MCPDRIREWLDNVERLIPLIDAVVSQTDRRVFKGEKVPAQEKTVSLYESHTGIIVKDRRDVQYGHKLNIAQGKSRLILDMVIEKGNPADSDRYIPMVKRQKEIYGRVPRQTATVVAGVSQWNIGYANWRNISGVGWGISGYRNITVQFPCWINGYVGESVAAF